MAIQRSDTPLVDLEGELNLLDLESEFRALNPDIETNLPDEQKEKSFDSGSNIDPGIGKPHTERSELGNIFTGRKNDADKIASVLDTDWVRNAFMVEDIKMPSVLDANNRYFSTADWKFTDTSWGGNIGVNTLPQYTRYADIRRPGRVAGRQRASIYNTSGDHGMGRYYSESEDDNAQLVYFRFGVPTYTGLASFISRALDPEMLQLSKTGAGKGLAGMIGSIAGTAVGFIAYPKVAVLMLTAQTAAMIFSSPRYKFYTLKPTMHNYWNAVNLMVNTLAVNLKLMPTILKDDYAQKIGSTINSGITGVDSSFQEAMAELLPGIVSKDGYIDIFAVVNKAQAAANNLFLLEYNALNEGSKEDYYGHVKRRDENINTTYTTRGVTGLGTYDRTISSFFNRHFMFGKERSGPKSLESFMEEIATEGKGWYDTSGEGSTEAAELNPNVDSKDGSFKELKKEEALDFFNYLDSEFRNGTQFATFRVDYTRNASESFSNSVVESEISNTINSSVTSARNIRFGLGDGNILGGSGSIVDTVVDSVQKLASNFIDAATFGVAGGIMSLIKGSMIDIPKHWDSSSASLPTANYKMTLVSPYNNPISKLQNIYTPLIMLLAGMLPHSTGGSSHHSPFICELFDKGKVQIRLGMITNLSITRGVSNLGFSKDRQPLAIDVSFDVTDMSSLITMPISHAGFGEIFKTVLTAGTATGKNPALSEDSLLVDYLAVLAGQDMYSQLYPFPKAKMNAVKSMIRLRQLSSSASWANWVSESAHTGLMEYTPLGLLRTIIDGTIPPATLMSSSANM